MNFVRCRTAQDHKKGIRCNLAQIGSGWDVPRRPIQSAERNSAPGCCLTQVFRALPLASSSNCPGGTFKALAILSRKLAAVLFESDFDVHRAALIPISVIRARARRSAHTNSHVFHLREDVWTVPGVRDVTVDVRAAADVI